MNSKKLLTIIGILCFVAAAAMFITGTVNNHLTELKDFFWVPLPAGLLLLLIAGWKK